MQRSWNTALSVSSESIFNPAVSRITSCRIVVLLFSEEGYFGTLLGIVRGRVRRNLSLNNRSSLSCVWGETYACHWPVAGVENVFFPFIMLGGPCCYQALSLHLCLRSLIGSRWKSGTPVQTSCELHIWHITVNEYLKEPCTPVTQ